MVRYLGTGTEKIEEVTQQVFPTARIARMDGDSMRAGNAYQRILTQFQNREIDILIGTQMIAKGLDFHNITLVGVIQADSALNFPDFRAAERTFQLICQVSGRTGRGGKQGRVIIQTFQPEHYAIHYASRHNYTGFAKEELQFRETLGYPPYGYLLRILVRGENLEAVALHSENIAENLRRLRLEGVEILGPAPAPITRIKNKHRFQILAKSQTVAKLQRLQMKGRTFLASKGDIQCAIDIDPLAML
jgi:primosomal protein N' (replication factor Y)